MREQSLQTATQQLTAALEAKEALECALQAAQGEAQKLKQQLLSIFNMVMKTEEQAMKETAEGSELSVSEIHTLVAVGRKSPKTMSTIAQDLLINVSTLSIAINKLEKKGFVMRVRDDSDRRIVRISLTEKGRDALAKHEQFYYRIVDEAIRDMDSDQKRLLVRSVGHMLDFFSSQLNSDQTAEKSE